MKYFIFIFLMFSQILEAQCSDKDVAALIDQYRNRDGAQFIEVGSELSKYLVKCDSVFFRQMSYNPDVYSEWLKVIEVSTFTIFEAGNDKLEQQLYSAYYDKLKQLMIISAKKWVGNDRYKIMAEQMIKKLNEIEIRFID